MDTTFINQVIPETTLENLAGNYDVRFLSLNNLPDFYSNILKKLAKHKVCFSKDYFPT